MGKQYNSGIGASSSTSSTPITITAAATSDIVGVSGSTFTTGPVVASGEARIDGVRYYDAGQIRYILVDITDFDDNEVIYRIEPNIMPTDGEILGAYILGRSGSDDGGNYNAGPVSGEVNQFFYDRNNSIDVSHSITVEVKISNPNATGTTSVVAGTVEAQDLSYLIASPSVDQTVDTLDSSDNMPFTDTVSSIGTNITNNNDGSFTLAPGRYKLSAALAFTADGGELTNPNFRWFNVTTGTFLGTESFYVDFTGDSSPKPCDPIAILEVASDTVIAVRPSVNIDNSVGFFQQESHVTIEQVSTYSVITPESIQVVDQAATGLLDIGETRIQWGRATTDITGAITLVFPEPMADSNYAINITAANGNNTTMSYLFDTPTSVQVIARNTSDGPVNTSFSWEVKGLKP